MGLLTRIKSLARRLRPESRSPRPDSDAARHCRFEPMEPRRMLDADPLQFGAVFVEADLGSDLQGDTFELTFEGGAPGTELERVVIRGDSREPGFGEGDVIFDTEDSGIGADKGFPFTVVSLRAQDPTATVRAIVADGQSELILEFERFQAGDKLVFSIDTDEVELFDPGETDLERINDGIDPITSGVEFQGTRLNSEFSAPHYHDAAGGGTFINRYDDLFAGRGLDLPSDDAGGQRDRTDGVAFGVQQQPLPVQLAGTVYLDHNLNLQQESSEAGLEGVELRLWRRDAAQFVPTGHVTHTGPDGDYVFGAAGDLLPGTYEIRQVQPAGLFSVGAVPGTRDGVPVGSVSGADVLTRIDIPLGGQTAIDLDFAEARPASIQGFVYHDRSHDGLRDAGEEGIGGTEVHVIPIETIAPQQPLVLNTAPDGAYAATGLAPGRYRVVEAVQPAAFFDGLDMAGSVGGETRGSATNPGDAIEDVQLLGGDAGIEYNFGELAPASLSGNVHLSDPQGDCFGNGAVQPPLADVTIRLRDSDGALVRETRTDANGDYRFDQLLPGVYTIEEVTPGELLDGGERVGQVAGVAAGIVLADDTIGGIALRSGQQGTDYDFCEHAPSSLSGFVYHDENANGILDAGEAPIEGVTVTLSDAGGTVAAHQTRADGFYEFTGLAAGTYTLRQTHPEGWIDWHDAAGTIDGTVVGTALPAGDEIRDITLAFGQHGVHYDFGELAAAKLGGNVYHDANHNGTRDPGEEGIPGVALDVIPIDTLAPQATIRVVTGADGMYMTDVELVPGRYRIVETEQPAGFLDGLDAAGTVNGRPEGLALNDQITEIRVGSGERGTDFDFGELRPASLEGRVHLSEPDGDCFDPERAHEGLAGVQVVLMDDQGQTVQQTTTNAGGEYAFRNLRPGTYTIVESTPSHLIDGAERVGRVEGTTVGEIVANDRIRGIQLASGQRGRDYDFCEHAPASVSGFVYHDRNNDGRRGGGEEGISDVEVRLLDDQNQVVASTRTDASGFYAFTRLAAGEYTLVEQHPDGWMDGKDLAGRVNGLPSGDADAEGDAIRRFALTWGAEGVEYNFGELQAGSIGGFVHADPNENCRFDTGEAGLAGVTIHLRNQDGERVATTTTDGNGHYVFTRLAPGRYTIEEEQPSDHFHGGQRAGSGGGDDSQADRISHISLGSGAQLVDYNFCELPPASIAGIVHLDRNGDCVQQAGDDPVAGVTIELLNADREVLATTRTDGAGRYAFMDLKPGEYRIREVQPDGLFDGGQRVGTGDGREVSNDVLAVRLGAGEHVVDYNFCELAPARISGFVFQDGDVIITPDGSPPDDLQQFRDGARTPDDTPLAGVTLELRNGLTGEAILGDAALPGRYGDGPIRVVTDASGFYEFDGIPGNASYAVFEIQPEGYVDGIDTPGTTMGLAINRGALIPQFVLNSLLVSHSHDAIVRIPLGVGAESLENNFSEVLVEAEPPELPAPPPVAGIPPVAPRTVFTPPLIAAPIAEGMAVPRPEMVIPVFGAGSRGVTWHLSVVDAGMPRGIHVAHHLDAPVWRTATYLEMTNWEAEAMRSAQWMLGRAADSGSDENDEDDEENGLLRWFGIRGAVPVAGDFNGDGIDEIGVFIDGEWFLDLNGNGQWDSFDLWAKLGGANDAPVTGDWDGDGKDDIGIFGPEWPRDSRAIKVEPGLPDLANRHEVGLKNVPPRPEDAAAGVRVLHLNASGPRRADLIDHVFRFGNGRDIPVTGDWNGDGIRSIGIFRDGRWQLDLDGDGRFTGRDAAFQFGQAGDLPVVGDFDGNGVEEVGIFRDGFWRIDVNRNHEMDAHDKIFEMGGAGDQPVAGDWNGDGQDEPGVYREP